MSFGGYLQANTAVDILIGPFVDDTDGKTAETGLTLDVELSKNGQALANKHDATTPVHDAAGDIDGYYNCELDATDTNTEGTLAVVCYAAGALPVRHDFLVISQAAYASIVGAKDTGYMDVNVKAVSEDTTAADNLESACDNYSATRGLAGTALPAAAADAAGGLPVSDTGGLDLDALNTNVSSILTDTGTTLDGKLDTITADTNELQVDWTDGGRLDLIVDAILADTNELQTDDTPGAISAVDAKIDTIDGIVDSILVDTGEIGVAGAGLSAVPWNAAWDAEIQSECTDALNAYDPPTKAELDTAVADVSVDEIQVSALADLFNTDSGTDYASAAAGSVVKEIADNAGGSALTEAGIADAVWDEAIAGHTSEGTTGEKLNDAGSAGDPWNTALPGAYGAGTAGKIVGDNINAPIATVDTVVDAIKAKTDNLPASPAAVGSAMTLADDAITSAKYDETTAFPVKSADTGSTQIARVGADSDTLETISDQLDIIVADTNELQTDDIPSALTAIDAKIDTIDGIVDAILVDTGEIGAAGAGLTDVAIGAGGIAAASFAANSIEAAATANDFIAEVNAQAVDALATDTYAEPGQGAPAATASISAKIGYLYKAWRNKTLQSATEYKLYNDAGDTIDQKSAVSDDGTDFTKGEVGSGA